MGPSDVVTLIVVAFYRFCPTSKLSSASDGNRDRLSLGTALLCRMCDPDGMDWLLDNEKAVTLTRRAISCSPICQCMASAAQSRFLNPRWSIHSALPVLTSIIWAYDGKVPSEVHGETRQWLRLSIDKPTTAILAISGNFRKRVRKTL